MRAKTRHRAKTPPDNAVDPKTAIEERPDWFKRFVDLTTLLVITTGLYLGLDQANKLTESIESSNRSNDLSTWSTITTQGMEIDRIFVEHPEFQKYFFENVTIAPDDPDFAQAKAISVTLLDYIDSALVLLNYMSQTRGKVTFVEHDTWHRYFVSLFRSSPLLCQTLIESKDVYGKETLKVGLPSCQRTAAPPSSRLP